MVGPFVFACGDFVKDGTNYFISWYGVNMEVGAKVKIEVEEKEEAEEEEGTTEGEEEEGAEEEGAEEEEEEEACDSE